MKSNGLYLIDNGYLYIIYIKQGLSTSLATSLFGTDDYSQIEYQIIEENVLANPDEIKTRIINIVEYLRG